MNKTNRCGLNVSVLGNLQVMGSNHHVPSNKKDKHIVLSYPDVWNCILLTMKKSTREDGSNMSCLSFLSWSIMAWKRKIYNHCGNGEGHMHFQPMRWGELFPSLKLGATKSQDLSNNCKRANPLKITQEQRMKQNIRFL